LLLLIAAPGQHRNKSKARDQARDIAKRGCHGSGQHTDLGKGGKTQIVR
jgi:hypothetical protein